jgi:hypothetical protein
MGWSGSLDGGDNFVNRTWIELAQDCVQGQALVLVVLNLQVLLSQSCQPGYLMVNNQNLITRRNKNVSLCHQIQSGYEANLSDGCQGLFHQLAHSAPCTYGALHRQALTLSWRLSTEEQIHD